MTESVRISVITACFNSEGTVRATIASVNAQTYSNIEHVFIDGGSNDSTLDIISAEGRSGRSILSEADSGIYDALNKGLRRSDGDVIGFLHADDFYAGDDVLARIATCFEDPGIQAVYGDLQYVSHSNTAKIVRNWRTKPFSAGRLKRGWMPPHPALYIRKHWYNSIGGFDTSFRIAADYYSILQLFSDTEFRAVYIPEVLVRMRLGGASNRSLKNIIQKTREDYSALTRTGVGGVGTLVAKNLRKLGQFF